MSSLEELRAQARELAALIKDKENALLGKLSQDSGEDDESEDDSAVPLEECRDVRCAFKVVVDNIRHGHEELCEGARGWRAYFGCGSGLDVTEEFIMEDEDDMEWLDDEEWDAEDFYFTEEDMTRYPQSVSSIFLNILLTIARICFANKNTVSHFHAHARRRDGIHLWRRRLLHHCHSPTPHPPRATPEPAPALPGRPLL